MVERYFIAALRWPFCAFLPNAPCCSGRCCSVPDGGTSLSAADARYPTGKASPDAETRFYPAGGRDGLAGAGHGRIRVNRAEPEMGIQCPRRHLASRRLSVPERHVELPAGRLRSADHLGQL